MRRAGLLLACGILSIQYALELRRLTVWNWQYYFEQPFVYRQLVPALAGLLPFDWFTSIAIVTGIFCLGLAAAMLSLYETCWQAGVRNDAAFLAAFALTLLALTMQIKFYDVPTAFFWTCLLVLWMRGRLALSVPVFALACLNRETTVLLVPVFMLIQIGRSNRNLLMIKANNYYRSFELRDGTMPVSEKKGTCK